MPYWCIHGYDGESVAFRCFVPDSVEPAVLTTAAGLPDGDELNEGYYPLTPMAAVAILLPAGVEALPANLRYVLEEDWS